ncbi:hypothetical protein B7494_g2554 [Chlorociboria aeruginascens]|nr:hypothetical protein B7494_g2554 [Chlorociboria aeruginascens]
MDKAAVEAERDSAKAMLSEVKMRRTINGNAVDSKLGDSRYEEPMGIQSSTQYLGTTDPTEVEEDDFQSYSPSDIQDIQDIRISPPTPQALAPFTPPSFPSISSRSTPPLYSTSPVLTERFSIPTRTDSLSSGFPYHQRLYDLKISHDEWYLFSSEIVKAGKLEFTDDWAAWTAGVTTGVVSSAGLLVFGPVVGYYTGRTFHRKAVVKKVQDGLLHNGELRSTLRRWNEDTFRSKGFQIWLQMPTVKGENTGEAKPATRKGKKHAKKDGRRFRVLFIPNDTSDEMMGSAPVTPLAEASSGERRLAELNASLRVVSEAKLPSYAETKSATFTPKTMSLAELGS